MQSVTSSNQKAEVLKKNKTAFITLTTNYVHGLIIQQKTKTDYLRGLSGFVFIVSKLGPFERAFL